MKSVLLSIQPKWCELIASGKKTIEVRKTKPKIETPFKVLIYCTKPRHFYKISKHLLTSDEGLFLVNGKVKMCDGFGVEYEDRNYKHLNCKVIGEFVCDEIFPIRVFDNGCIQDYACHSMERSLLSYDDISNYIGKGKTGYGWHISDLVIYDNPLDINDFVAEGDCTCEKCNECKYFEKGNGYNVESDCLLPYQYNFKIVKPLFRPPQSWCYIYDNV